MHSRNIFGNVLFSLVVGNQNIFLWVNGEQRDDNQCSFTIDPSITIGPSITIDPSNCTAESSKKEPQRTCGLYLAKSTIPNAGLGFFSGVYHDVGDVLGPAEIAHQLLLRFDGRDFDHFSLKILPDFNKGLLNTYAWDSYMTGGSFEADHAISLTTGVGAASNCMGSLLNTKVLMGKSIDSASLYSNGTIGPGAGAFSAYHGVTHMAYTPIQAGGEIFIDYGDEYFRSRQSFGLIPLTDDFRSADTILQSLWEALPKKYFMDHPNGTMSSEMASEWQPAWDVIREILVQEERTRNALPKYAADVPQVAKSGTSQFFLGGDNPRPLEWLSSNGYCMDMLDVRKSSIPHAGRGAFAKDSFAIGDRILALPLLQISRNALDIYATMNDVGEDEELYSRQLLLNYCLGHKNSSVLLMPYSSTAHFINHATNANAKLVWASSESDPTDCHQDEWLLMSAEEVLEKQHTGLLMHVIATRSIAKDEEITIDYGPDWVDAWTTHAEHWVEHAHHVTAAEFE
jgi:hypothetical protein